MALERCLAAAKALGDRAVEARTLHELGTRAACLGETDSARRLLGEAATLRDSLGEHAAAAVSRKNLSLVQPPTPGDSRDHVPGAVARMWDLDSAPVHDPDVFPSHTAARRSRMGALVVVLLLCGVAAVA